MSGAAAIATSIASSADWRETIHANAQVFIDIGVIMTPIWLAVQCGCKLYVTFLRGKDDGD